MNGSSVGEENWLYDGTLTCVFFRYNVKTLGRQIKICHQTAYSFASIVYQWNQNLSIVFVLSERRF